MADRQQGIQVWNLPFPKTRWAIIGFVAGVFTWSFAGGGQQHIAHETSKAASDEEQGAIGTVDNAFRKLSQGIQDTTANVRDRISDVQSSAHLMSLSAKVKDRLSREKSIDDDRIEVETKDKGTVVLKGQVPTRDDKSKAVDITRETEGVLRVEDRLSVPPAARFYATKTDETGAEPRSRPTQ